MTIALTYQPVDQKTQVAAAAFITDTTNWAEKALSAIAGLRTTCQDLAGRPSLGIIYRGPLKNNVFAVSFKDHPGDGFKVAPAAYTAGADLPKDALAFIPDTRTEKGLMLADKLREVSDVFGDRPLFATDSIWPAVVRDGNLVLTRAVKNEAGQVVIQAHPDAVEGALALNAVSAIAPAAAARRRDLPKPGRE